MWDHPRSCGKDQYLTNSKHWDAGSPPLVRERLSLSSTLWNLLRITPARAGKTCSTSIRPCCRRDHPRSCGKDAVVERRGSHRQGSPPLVRERRPHVVDYRIVRGITPARAGKTSPLRSLRRCIRDHPRSCGKDASSNNLFHTEWGSPPLVRERPMAIAEPASFFGDHPRSCGKDE